MTVSRAFAIICLSAVLFALAGGAVGYALAKTFPTYYIGVMPGRADRGPIDPVDVGVGLGVSEGLLGGLGVGCVVVLAVAISNRPRIPNEAGE